MLQVLGKNLSRQVKDRFTGLANYQNGRFENLEGVRFSPGEAPMGKMLVDFLRKPRTVAPAGPLPTVRTNLHRPATAQPTVIWFGHSSYLIQAQGLNILVDPVFSGAASPFSFAVRAFAGANAYAAADMPAIDVLVLTHDHYDHLDYATVVALRANVRHIVTPLGVGSHLQAWGYAPGQITELNWHETATPVPGVHLTATPAQHFSGRSLRPRQTLWSSYVLQLDGARLFLGGDSGYGPHFRAIGRQYGIGLVIGQRITVRSYRLPLALVEVGKRGLGRSLVHVKKLGQQRGSGQRLVRFVK